MTDKQIINCEYCIVLGNENKCKTLGIETHTCLGITAKNKCPIYKLKIESRYWESAAMLSKRKEEELEQYKKSKQASYETMQKEWNEAKNEVKKLKADYDNLIIHYDNQLKAVIDKHNELLEEKNQLATKNMKLRVALLKIKEIAKPRDCVNPEDCIENKPDWNGEICGCDPDDLEEDSETTICPGKLAHLILNKCEVLNEM